MFPSSGPLFALWPRGQRWLLVVLTLIASVAHLARSPQAGGLGLPGAWGGAALIPVAPKGAVVQGAGMVQSPDQMAGMEMPQTAAGRPAASAHVHGDVPLAAAPGLSDAAPNAPPHHTHTSDAHCPFCLCAGFALEAQPAVFIVGLAVRALWTVPVCPGPLLAPLRHADARAPPCPAGR